MNSLIDTYTSVLGTVILLDDLEYKAGGLRNNLLKLQAEAAKIQKKEFGSGSFAHIIEFILIAIGFICASFLGAIVAFIGYVILCSFIDTMFFEGKRKKWLQQFQADQIEPILGKIKECEAQIAEVRSSNEITYFETHFPPECQSIETLQFFVDALLYGRAETEKELYNLWAEESYRQQMLQMQSKQIQQNQYVIDNQQEQSDVLNKHNELLRKQISQQRKLSRQVRYGNVVTTLAYLKKK